MQSNKFFDELNKYLIKFKEVLIRIKYNKNDRYLIVILDKSRVNIINRYEMKKDEVVEIISLLNKNYKVKYDFTEGVTIIVQA